MKSIMETLHAVETLILAIPKLKYQQKIYFSNSYVTSYNGICANISRLLSGEFPCDEFKDAALLWAKTHNSSHFLNMAASHSYTYWIDGKPEYVSNRNLMLNPKRLHALKFIRDYLQKCLYSNLDWDDIIASTKLM